MFFSDDEERSFEEWKASHPEIVATVWRWVREVLKEVDDEDLD